jgi:hypothetical protein
MKKLAFIIVSLGLAVNVNAGTIAPSETPGANAVNNAGCAFVAATSPFNMTPSRNVGLGYTCTTTGVAVNAGNTKGKYTYGGSTNGGSVAQCPVAVVASTTTGYGVAAPDVTKDGCI